MRCGSKLLCSGGPSLPIGVVDRSSSMSSTVTASYTLVAGPSDWTREKLLGYVAGRHAELEAAYGRIARVRSIEEAA
jgi:hypothetical protein